MSVIQQMSAYEMRLSDWSADVVSSDPPCLVGGAKAFRMKPRPGEADWFTVLRDLASAAAIGLERLHGLKRGYRDAQRTIAAEYRPGALPRLLALSQHRPLLSPQSRSEEHTSELQ